METARPRPGAVRRPLAFPVANRFCVARLCGRAGRLAALFGGFRPGQIAARAKSFAAGSAPVAGGYPWPRCTDYCRKEMANSLSAGKLLVR